MMSECSKLAQRKYKTKHEWVGKMIHWNHTIKWYMYKPKSVLENVTLKIL